MHEEWIEIMLNPNTHETAWARPWFDGVLVEIFIQSHPQAIYMPGWKIKYKTGDADYNTLERVTKPPQVFSLLAQEVQKS